jgi:hypothetical protein
MTDWFRSWHGAPTDPKWLGIARRAGVVPGIAVAVAWALMDRASQAEDRGSIEGYDADGLAYFYGCEPEQVEAIVAAMSDKGMIISGRLSSWEKRQPKREDDSAQRVREYRERKKQHLERGVTPSNAPDTDTDLDSSLRSEDARAPEFDQFWEVYPNKVAEPAARAALSKALKRADISVIVAGAKAYAVKADDRQWCNPVKWLSEDRWKDIPAKPPEPPPKSPPAAANSFSTPANKYQSREEYQAAMQRAAERSFQR